MIVSALLKQRRLIQTKVHCTFCYSVRTAHILSKVSAAKKNFSIEILLVILKIWLWKVWWCPAFDILRFDCLQLSHLLPEKHMRSHCSFTHTFEKTFLPAQMQRTYSIIWARPTELCLMFNERLDFIYQHRHHKLDSWILFYSLHSCRDMQMQ